MVSSDKVTSTGVPKVLMVVNTGMSGHVAIVGEGDELVMARAGDGPVELAQE